MFNDNFFFAAILIFAEIVYVCSFKHTPIHFHDNFLRLWNWADFSKNDVNFQLHAFNFRLPAPAKF